MINSQTTFPQTKQPTATDAPAALIEFLDEGMNYFAKLVISSKLTKTSVFSPFALLVAQTNFPEQHCRLVYDSENVDNAIQIVEHFLSTFLPQGELLLFMTD